MKNLALSQFDLNIEEINLADIKGGKEIDEIIFSGSGIDATTGNTVNEYLVCFTDGSFEHAYTR